MYTTSVSNPRFPKPETRFFGYFLLPETRFFSTTKPGHLKKTGIAVAFKYYSSNSDQWRLVVKMAVRAAVFHLWLNISDCRPGCF